MTIRFALKTLVSSLVLATGLLAQTSPLTGLSAGVPYSNIAFGVSPSMAVFSSKVFVAYQMNDSSHRVQVTYSTNGTTWSNTQTIVPGVTVASATSPSITAFNGALWLAYTAQSNNFIYLTSSTDGVNWSTPVPTGLGVANSSPTLTTFSQGSYLILVFVQNGFSTTTTILTYSSTDGNHFSQQIMCSPTNDNQPQPQTGAAIGVAEYGNLGQNALWYSWQAQGNWNHELVVCNAPLAGASSYYIPSPQNRPGGGISAAVYGSFLYLNYENYGNHGLAVVQVDHNGSSTSGTPYSNNQINGNQQINPSAAIFNGLYYVTYTANSGSHYMYLTHN